MVSNLDILSNWYFRELVKFSIPVKRLMWKTAEYREITGYFLTFNTL